MDNPCEETLNNEAKRERPGMWFITYTNRMNMTYRGVAIVRAFDAGEAERIFLANSMHNGNAQKIKINKLYQIEDSYISSLVGEEYFKVM